MTNTLTEQWREGTLPDGHYYVQYDKCSPFIKDAYGMIELKRCIDSEKIKVLASVPTYAEFKDLMSHLEYIDKYRELVSKTEQLEKKLEIAFKVLHKFAFDYDDTTKPRVFIENSLVALGDMRGLE